MASQSPPEAIPVAPRPNIQLGQKTGQGNFARVRYAPRSLPDATWPSEAVSRRHHRATRVDTDARGSTPARTAVIMASAARRAFAISATRNRVTCPHRAI
jgi:hypothetical protein